MDEADPVGFRAMASFMTVRDADIIAGKIRKT
jgi:hypothetical protein